MGKGELLYYTASAHSAGDNKMLRSLFGDSDSMNAVTVECGAMISQGDCGRVTSGAELKSPRGLVKSQD